MAHLPLLRASAFPAGKGEAAGTKFSVLCLVPSLWYWVLKGTSSCPPTHTCTHIHFLSALMAGADRESPSSLLTSNTSMSALLKSMLRILGRGTPEPRTAVKGVGGESGQVSSMWPRGGSLAKSNQHLQDHSCLFCLLEVPAQKKPRLALALLCKGGMT